MNIRIDTANRELQKGESQRKDGSYMFRYTDSHGVRKAVYDSDLYELREKEARILRDLESGIGAGRNMTLNDQFERYMRLKSNICRSTYNNQYSLWEQHVKKRLGEQKICEIRKSDILALYASLSSDDGLKNSSIQRVHHLLNPCFDLAVDDDLIRKNPCKGCVKGYPSDTREKYALSISEQRWFLEFIRDSASFRRYYPLFGLMLETGMRRGEAVGLTWSDVDWEKNSIHINHQLQYGRIDGTLRLYADSPKTDAGIREIPLTEYAGYLLQQQRELRVARYSFVTIDGYTDFIFSTKNHTPYIPSNLNSVLAAIVRAFNKENTRRQLPHITAHILRHTACTRMAEAGMDPKVLQYVMGHSTIAMTMNVYNHTSEERIQKEMHRLDSRHRDHPSPESSAEVPAEDSDQS